jgi:hypothetical protein
MNRWPQAPCADVKTARTGHTRNTGDCKGRKIRGKGITIIMSYPAMNPNLPPDLNTQSWVQWVNASCCSTIGAEVGGQAIWPSPEEERPREYKVGCHHFSLSPANVSR